jgi:acyl-CoA thioester hydrolase
MKRSLYGYHETRLRVQFGQVDRYSVLWHGHAASFFEIARADMVRDFGLGAPDLSKSNLAVPMVEFSCEYFKPAFDDDALTVQSTLLQPELPVPELVFHYRVVRIRDQQELFRGRTRQLVTRSDGRIRIRVPSPFRERLEEVWAYLAGRPRWPNPSTAYNQSNTISNPIPAEPGPRDDA